MKIINIDLRHKVLSRNDEIAYLLRQKFNEYKILVINMVSSPGSGKTSIIEKTIERLHVNDVIVIEGDIQTENDAKRIESKGVIAIQITTGGACHLDANMINQSLEEEDLINKKLLIIENVGNLVCPSSYDLGEDFKVVTISTTEGDDKPLKYPGMFYNSKYLIINKIDLLPYVNFDIQQARKNALKINPEIEIFETSCTTNQGIDNWINFLKLKMDEKRTV